jgi:hypothetical protein
MARMITVRLSHQEEEMTAQIAVPKEETKRDEPDDE